MAEAAQVEVAVPQDAEKGVSESDNKIGDKLEENATGNPASSQRLTYWKPEDSEFWTSWGSKIATKNLIISIPNLCLMFATWIMWSVVVTMVQKAHDEDETAYSFADLNLDPADKKGYKAALFMLPSLAGLAGATLRVVNTFMVAVAGGQTPNAMNSTLAIVPMIGIGIALANKDCPFLSLCILAPCCGFGGGAFASSMSAISFFYPKKLQGTALGLNAGIGNLGVSLTQLLIPQVCSVSIGIAAIGGVYVANAGWFYALLLALAALPAWFFKNWMPQHGTASRVKNMLSYLRLEGIGFLGVILAVVLFIALNPLVAGKPALAITRIILLAAVACLTTCAALWFLSGKEIQDKLRVQTAIFSDKHTWLMTWLYIMTFGSFIGYSSSFPKLIKDVFGYLPNGDINPNAPAVSTFAWMGACIGSLSRPVGGVLSDKLGPQGGAIITHWSTVVEIVATVLVGFFLRQATEAEKPEEYFYQFLICFLVLFGCTGLANGSTFRQMSVSFPPEKAGPVLGWTSAVAAYGAAVFPACFGAGLQGDFLDTVLYVFAAYYTTCLVINFWFYYRKGAERPC